MLYGRDMDTREMSLREVRDELGRRVDAAHYAGEATVITKNGEPRAVLVPHRWFMEQGQSGDCK